MRRGLAALVLVLALAGCGGGGGGRGAGSASGGSIAQAAAKSSRAGSVKTDFTVQGSGAKGIGTGVFNTGKDRSGRLTMELEVNGRKSTLESIVTGNVLYMRSPVFAQAGFAGRQEWVKLDLAKLARQRGIGLSSLVNASPTPNSVLAYLRGAGKVENRGSETVRGVKTTHYHVNVDLERAAARADAATAESIRRVIRLSGLKKLPVDAWVDDHGYLRKVKWAEHTSPQQSAQVTMELYDFGPPVEIKPPPPDKVVDLLERLGGG
jgi:hypothetical protein